MDFKALIPTLQFTPTSYDEYMQPYILAETAYQQRKKELDDRDEILAKYLPYINDSTPEAKRLYDAAQQQLQRNLDQLGRKGWNLNPQPLIDFKKQYRETNAKLEKASADLAEQMKADKEAVAKDPTMYIAYKDKSGAFVKPNIDNMLLGDTTRHFVSGNAVQANAAASAKALSGRTKAAFANLSKRGTDEIGYYSIRSGFIGGVSSQVMMDWMMEPDKFKTQIDGYLKRIRQADGKDAADKMSALFNGDFRRAMNSALEMTDYDNMSDDQKLRINEHLWSGAYQGLSYDEQVQQNIQQYNHPARTPSGGGGGDAPTTDPVPASGRPQPFLPTTPPGDEEKVKQGRERIQKLKGFLGINDDMFGETGLLKFRLSGLYGLSHSAREYGGGDSVIRNNQAVDRFIDDPNVSGENGVKDYFSIFDNTGKIISEDDFVRDMTGKLGEITSGDYFEKHSKNENYGRLYKEYVRSKSGGEISFGRNASPRADEQGKSYYVFEPKKEAEALYKDIKHAVLDAFDVSEKEQEEILEDKEKWNKFVSDHNVNEGTFQNALVEMWDKYFNVEANIQDFNFTADNERIINSVLAKVPGKSTMFGLSDHDYGMKPVTADSYKFTTRKEDGRLIKELKIVPGELTAYDKKDLFGEGTNASYDCIYYIPPDPSQGLIVQFPTKVKVLIEPKLLGSLYPVESIKKTTDDIRSTRATIKDCVSEIKRLNTEFYSYQNGGHAKEEVEAKRKETEAKIKQQQNNIQKNLNTIRNYQSSMTDLIRNSLTLGYKPNHV